MKLIMDLVVNHTSDEHPWFVESRSSRDDPKRDWYWWRPPRAGFDAGRAGRRADQLALVLLAGRPGSSTRRPASTTCTCSRRKQPDLNWENPEVREAVYAMMRWWLDRGVDGFRMDVINMISKDTGAARRPRLAGRRRTRRRLAALPQRPAHPRVPRGDAPRGASRAGRRRCSPSARCPGSPSSEARPVHRPGPRARSTWSSSSSTCGSTTAPTQVGLPPARPPRPQGVARPMAGRPRRARLEQPLLEQPRPAARGVAVRRRRRLPRRSRPRCWPPCCTCTGARRTCTRARSWA